MRPPWVATDPTNASRLYAAVVDSNTTIGGIWVTNNLSAGAASTWTELPTPPRKRTGAHGLHPVPVAVRPDRGDLLRRVPVAVVAGVGLAQPEAPHRFVNGPLRAFGIGHI